MRTDKSRILLPILNHISIVFYLIVVFFGWALSCFSSFHFSTLFGVEPNSDVWYVLIVSSASFFLSYWVSRYRFFNFSKNVANGVSGIENIISLFRPCAIKVAPYLTLGLLLIAIYGLYNSIFYSSYKFEIYSPYSSIVHKIALLTGLFSLVFFDTTKWKPIVVTGCVIVTFLSMSRSSAMLIIIYAISNINSNNRISASSILQLMFGFAMYFLVIIGRNLPLDQLMFTFSEIVVNSSINNILETYIIGIINVDFVSSVSLAMNFHPQYINIDNLLPNYLAYLSPLPSSFIADTSLFSSLSRVSGIDIGTGINSDYFAEPYLVFGYNGAIYFWAIIGILCGNFDRAALLLRANHYSNMAMLLTLSIATFFMLGTVMSIRASTRIFFWLAVICLGLKYAYYCYNIRKSRSL